MGRARGLIDLGYVGLLFTWNHGSNVDIWCSARLNRGLCDDSWRRLFSSARIIHLTHAYLDHCPILLHLEAVDKNRVRDKPFRFHASRMLHRDFAGLMERLEVDMKLHTNVERVHYEATGMEKRHLLEHL